METPWYFYGGLALGGLLVLAGAFLFFIDLQLRRADVERRTLSAERAARIANADSVSTEGIPQVDDPDRQLTRRELRDKERAEASGEAWTDPRTGRVYLDGIEAPAVPQAPEMPTADGGGDGYGYGFGGYGESSIGQEEQSVAGVARGSSVVPGLDEEATQQYRAARGLEGLQDGEALAIASDDADASSAPGFSEAPAHTSHVNHHSHAAPSDDPAPEQREDLQDYSRFAPQEHHTSHVAGDPHEEQILVESDTAEIEDVTTSAQPQEPGLQIPDGLAQPEVQSWPAADQPQPEAQPWPAADRSEATSVPQDLVEVEEEVQEPAFPATSPADSSATSTTVSWPSYSDGVELPPAADPAAIQAAAAEPLGETDPTEDPHNQEHA